MSIDIPHKEAVEWDATLYGWRLQWEQLDSTMWLAICPIEKRDFTVIEMMT